MATILSKKSNYLWWTMFFLAFYSVTLVDFFVSRWNLVHGVGRSVFLTTVASSLNIQIGLSWLVQIVTALAIAFALTLPLLFFRFRKWALGVVALLFIPEIAVFFHFLKTSFRAEPSLALIFFPLFAGGYAMGYLILVVVPVLIQKKVNLDATIGGFVAVVVIVLEAVAALFLTALAVYSSLLATRLPVSQAAQLTASEQAACERMEQVSQSVRPWRGYFRDRCPPGVGERLPFPTITEEQFRQAAQACSVERYFLTHSGFAGLCLRDRTGYVAGRGSERYDQLLVMYREQHISLDVGKPERPECDFLDVDFRFGDSEEAYLKEMQKLCVPPVASQ